MTAQEIIDEVKIDIQQEDTVGGFSDTQLLALLNEGYTDFCRYTEVLHRQTTQTTAALTSLVPLPSNFLESRQMRWSYNIQLYPKSERKLDYDSRSWVFEVGKPEALTYFNFHSIRLKPITNAAGTVTFRYAYVPTDLTVSDTPLIPLMYHSALVSYVDSQCFMTTREYDSGFSSWKDYVTRREDAKAHAKEYQRTPDTFFSQKNVTVFNYHLWDSRYRTYRP